MSEAVSTTLYTVAVIAIPVSVAAKFLLGVEGATWIDPTLLLSVAALLALMPRWADFLMDDLRLAVGGAAMLVLVSLLCAVAGMLMRPPQSLYDGLREPLRLWLNLCFFVVSAWFLLHKPHVVVRAAIAAVILGLAAGIYLHLVAFGMAPASSAVVAYTRSYLLRQTLWWNGFPLPRMGGLFFESPPFGLFMYSMLIVLLCTRSLARYGKWTLVTMSLAVAGMLFSLADQVLLAGSVGLFSALPALGKNRPAVVWPSIVVVSLLIIAFEFQAISDKSTQSNTGIVSRINGSSVGERSFHVHYGLALLQANPKATAFGIGPGRYGEYASETGMFADTVNIQTSELEILVEWGIAGLAVMLVLLACVATRTWELRGVPGIGLLASLILADSFQANWKYEAVFLAIAALCTSGSRTLHTRVYGGAL